MPSSPMADRDAQFRGPPPTSFQACSHMAGLPFPQGTNLPLLGFKFSGIVWGKGVVMDSALYIALGLVIAVNVLLVVVAISGAIHRKGIED